MSTPEIVSIVAGLVLLVAIIYGALSGSTRKKRGPIHANKIPENSPTAVKESDRPTTSWPLVKGAIWLVALVAITAPLVWYRASVVSTATEAWAAFRALSWLTVVLLAALLLALAYVLRNTKFPSTIRQVVKAAAYLLIFWAVLMPIEASVAWLKTPSTRTATAYSNPEVFRDAVAKELSSDSCPGKMVVLDKSNPSISISGQRCLFYYKVITGTFKVDGTNGYGFAATPLTLTPQGAMISDNEQFYARHARLASIDGEMQVLECPTGSVIRHWKCWDR